MRICRTVRTMLLTAAVACSWSQAEVTFFVVPTAKVPDAKADLPFQQALASPFSEFDFRAFGRDHLRSPSPLCAGSNQVTPRILDAAGRAAIDAAEPGACLVETFLAGPGQYPAVPGAAEDVFLINRTQTSTGKDVVGRSIEFTFARPVRGFGAWIMEDFQQANGFVLAASEVGGKVSTSDLLESGNGATLSVEGFLGVVSTVGIEKVVIEQRTLDGSPTNADFFYVDHVQVARSPEDANRTECEQPALAVSAEKVGGRFFDVVRGSASTATLVIPEDEAAVWAESAKLIADSAERWGGGRVSVTRLPRDASLPDGNIILIGTGETSAIIEKLSQDPESPVSSMLLGDDHGFAIETRAVHGARQLVIAGKTPRGAYNAAVFCRDFVLDAAPGETGRGDVFVREAAVVRSPQLAVRGTYTLSFYGRAVEYTAEDWMRIVDRFAQDGMNRVNFWLSGHHPSRKYPHLYNVEDPTGQSTKGTRLTVEGVARLIRYCHDRGIEFFIGGGVFAWVASEQLAKGHPEIVAVAPLKGLCPSKPLAREGVREHFLEMYDTWPEADGFMFEIRDEYGECQCPDCQVAVDAFGSKHYGRAEITWLQEFAHAAWKRKPTLRFCWLIGYAEHARDVYYYDQIRRMNDPRFDWLDVRVGLPGPGAGALPGPGGVRRPFSFFSPRIQHWDPFYALPVKAILSSALKTKEHGMNGYVPAFEPGPWVGSASYYGDVVPLPVDILPYCLTGLAYREGTWNPGIGLSEFRRIVHQRYFSPDAAERFADDMLYLHQFSLEHWNELRSYGKYGTPKTAADGTRLEPTIAGQLQRVQAISDEAQRRAEAAALLGVLRRFVEIDEELSRMSGIEAAMAAALPQASPKTREGFAILRRMIEDTRALYRESVPSRHALDQAIALLKG